MEGIARTSSNSARHIGQHRPPRDCSRTSCVCVCMHVCVYVCVYVCIYIYVYIYVYIYICIYMYILLCGFFLVSDSFMSSCICKMYIYIYIYIYVYIYACMYICMHTCVFYVFICMSISCTNWQAICRPSTETDTFLGMSVLLSRVASVQVSRLSKCHVCPSVASVQVSRVIHIFSSNGGRIMRVGLS